MVPVLFITFIICLFIGVPVAFSLGFSALAYFLGANMPIATFSQRFFAGLDSFTLLCIPGFTLAGNLMNQGGISDKLMDFCDKLVGHLTGGMAYANIMASMIFAGISGTALSDTVALGGIEIPMMVDLGYDADFSVAVTAASSCMGPIIPPSLPMIMAATMTGLSVSKMFMAGIVPGILMGLCCMVVAFIGAKKAGMKATGIDHSQSIAKTVWDAVPSLLLIVIVIGGIVSGIFTATEGAGVAVLYCLILSIVYKSIDFKGFLGILLNSAKTSGIILFLISASSAMSFVMAYSGIPAAISNGLMSLTENKYIIFLLMNIILLVIGMFMDITPAILIFTPIFLPIATSFGMTEIQFGVMLIFNMCLGNITPPVGSVLFVGCGIGHVSIEQVTSKLIPYFVALVAALLAVTYIPALSLGLPSLMGLI